MKISFATFAMFASLASTTAVAAPVDAISTLSLSHSWLVNSGNVPTGIEIENLSTTYTVNTDLSTLIDDPTAVEATSQNTVIGNPFSNPVVPFQSFRSHVTTVDDSADFSAAFYDYEVAMENDLGDDAFDIVRRDIDQIGFARVNLEENDTNASALASVVSGRDFRFNNTTDDRISFNLTGLFDADLSATFDGEAGSARTSGGFNLLFEQSAGVSINYFPVAPYLSSTTESGPDAFVTDLYLANDGGVTGIGFGASTTAIGNGGYTEALFSGESRYVFGISLDAGASVLMQTSYHQSNSVVVEPATHMPPVPLPASLPLILAGLACIAALRRKHRTS